MSVSCARGSALVGRLLVVAAVVLGVAWSHGAPPAKAPAPKPPTPAEKEKPRAAPGKIGRPEIGPVTAANLYLRWGRIDKVSGNQVAASKAAEQPRQPRGPREGVKLATAEGAKPGAERIPATPAAGPTAGAEKIAFTTTPEVARQLSVGQMVWLNPTEKKVKFVIFPIESHRKDNLGNSHYMDTDVKVSSPATSDLGRIDGKTRTWSKEALRGFTGGVVVYLMDDLGQNLYNTKLHKYGVNGEAVPGASSDRTEVWKDEVPKDVLAATRKVAIVHVDSPTDHWDDFMRKAKEVAELAKTGAEVYTTVAGAGGAGGGTAPGGTGPTEPTP